MTSSPDTVSGRGRGANGGFRRWTVTLRPAIRILGSFRIDVEFWAVLLALCFLLMPAVVRPSFAASNAILVLTVGSVACLVGSRVGYLAAWPGGILVPRYAGTLFVLCVGGVVLATLLAGFVCWSLGNSAPALAPAMFVGAAMVHQAIRLPHVVVGIWFLILVFATMFEVGFAEERQPLVADAVSLLSHAWIQLPALIGTGLIVPRAYRALVRETIVIDRVVSSPSGHGNFPLEDLRYGAWLAALALGTIILLWYFFPNASEAAFLILWLIPLMMTVHEWWQSNVHVQLSRNWIYGIARDRRDLGRRAAARVVLMSLPWLVLGAGGSVIHALATPSAEAFLLKEVLLVQIAALLVATLLCHVTPRLPPSFFGRTGIYIVLLGLAGGPCAYLAEHDHAIGYVTLILALIGAVLLTVFVGGRALARAEILSDSPQGWRARAHTGGRGLR